MLFKIVYFATLNSGECVTVEEFIPGKFTKYINNNGIMCVGGKDTIGQKKMECLVHSAETHDVRHSRERLHSV